MHVGGLVGSPETIRAKLRKFEQSHVDQVILLNQAGRNTHEDICASLELFASEVMPEFHARDVEQQTWKRGVLAGDIHLEEIDTAPENLPRPQRRPIETPAWPKLSTVPPLPEARPLLARPEIQMPANVDVSRALDVFERALDEAVGSSRKETTMKETTMLVVSGILTFDPDDHDRVLPVAQAVAAATREETGCLAYTVWVDPTAKGRYHVFEEWVDAAALKAHEATPHIAELLRALGDLRVRSIEFTRYEVSGKRDLF